MKRKFCFLLAVFLLNINVYATNDYYRNSRGVTFTKSEYDYVSELYWNGYQDIMTEEDYVFVFEDGIGTNIEFNVSQTFVPYSAVHTTGSKSLKITKADYSSYTFIIVTLDWLVMPKVRSYDVIGGYLNGVTLDSTVNTKLIYGEGQQPYQPNKLTTNGLGVSMRLPSSTNEIKVTQSYKVTGTGTIYASYQHATTSVTLADSKNYVFSMNGSGGVFGFSDSVNGYYDQMRGVDIAI